MENEVPKHEESKIPETPSVISVPVIIKKPTPTTEEELAGVKQEILVLKGLLVKMHKTLTDLKDDTEMLVSIEYQRLLPSWKNKFIDFLVAVFHTQPHEEEEESRRKTL